MPHNSFQHLVWVFLPLYYLHGIKYLFLLLSQTILFQTITVFCFLSPFVFNSYIRNKIHLNMVKYFIWTYVSDLNAWSEKAIVTL